MRILVTGNAGFIGFHVAKALLERGDTVIGIDNVNDYYDVSLKEARLKALEETAAESTGDYTFLRKNIADNESVSAAFEYYKPEVVIHLAAQAGVRYSLENPHAYADSNLTGFLNILEGCRHTEVQHLIFASSSSVYGENEKQPFSEDDPVDHPVSLYAATKKANEVMAHSYAHLYDLPVTGLRFFTVYGPWGRPDMAPMLFAKALFNGYPIKVFNHGNMKRDFTYVDDIVQGVIQSAGKPPVQSDKPENETPATSDAPYQLFNIGNSKPVNLMDFIESLESAAGKSVEKQFMDMQPGDVPVTYAETTRLEAATGYKPTTPIRDGVAKFVDWYRDYYGNPPEK